MRRPTKILATLSLILVVHAVEPQRVIAQCRCGTVCACADCPHVDRTYRQGRWFVLETANFQVCCEQAEGPAKHIARHAEALRNALYTKWLGKTAPDKWSPKCQIVLYANQRTYVAAVGRGSERTVGSSLVNVDKGRITSRRIDLLGANTEYLSAALPHELTHVVLKDRFITTALPRWADEGIAILADTEAKQGRHFKDLQNAIASRTTFHVANLLMMDEYPRSDSFGAFYGQSASLTEFLVSRKTPESFIEFVDQAGSEGYDKALQRYYGFSGLADLDRQWRRYVTAMRSTLIQGG
jgi:hypothetical protein